MKRRLLTCFAMLSLLVLVAGAVASPAAAAPGGNATKACQKGGWETLARSGDAGTPFVSQKECVNYASKGGTLVPYVPELNPTINISFDPTGDSQFCLPKVELVDFAANTAYPVSVQISYYDASTVNETYNGSQLTDSDGFWSGYPIGSYREAGVGVNYLRVVSNGITTAWYDIEC